MISIKTAILAGTVVVGLAGFTAYASGTFCTTETAQSQPTQAIFTSGGDKSCCADDMGTKASMTQNAVFTPKVQTAALESGSCPYEAKHQAALTTKGEACGAKTSATTASMANAGEACGAKTTMASLATDGKSCDATATTASLVTSGEACGAKTTTMASLATDGKSCCAPDGVKTTASKTTLAGVIPTATTTN
jgi:hypothetical protein